MSEYILRTEGITKKYGSAYALDNVSIEIKRGQIYGLIGLNGAGKSTFMRVVMGLTRMDNGHVELFGKSGEPALRHGRSRIGQFIETPALYQNMTAEQNLKIQQTLGGASGKSDIKSVLKTVGLGDVGKKKAGKFSLGMRQRLALAMSLITDPEFLILDEPVNGLDPKGIIEIRNLMRLLAEERGLTLLLSSHLLDELAQVATSFGIIHEGRLIKQLTAEELSAQSRSYAKIVTSDAEQAAKLLQEKFHISDFRVASKTELQVFEQIEKMGEMNALLVKSEITVSELTAAGQKLEEYFVGLTGGGAA
jgi:ABC-2 type transport system ATP-binding protein